MDGMDDVDAVDDVAAERAAPARRLLVGVAPDDSGRDALALGAVLAPLAQARLVLANVRPLTMDHPGMGNVDAEWAAFVIDRANAAVDEARTRLAQEWAITDVDTFVHPDRSVGHGLRRLADDLDAAMVVLGPAPGGQAGRVSLGSAADLLLHSSSAAVALAPEGYRETAPDAISRIVVGFRDTPEAHLAVESACIAGELLGLPVHLLTVILRVTRIVGSRLGRDPERALLDALTEQERFAQQRYLRDEGTPVITGSVVRGDTADRAISRFDWQEGDVFVLGSSSAGPLRRVFLGDMTHRLVRAASVPTIVLPRGFEAPGQPAA